jgi:[CysO sulfur-carrier protein]-S-L-cysteine hydrolase
VKKEFRIGCALAAELLAQARSQRNIECCGLLAGRLGAPEEIFAARNSLNSATAYEIAPQELFSHFRTMRERGLELAGIYHSHPTGDNSPSKTDVDLAYYPGVPYIIISSAENPPRAIRAFQIAEGSVSELAVVVV